MNHILVVITGRCVIDGDIACVQVVVELLQPKDGPLQDSKRLVGR